jgi:predicted ester cyclase
MIASQIKSFIHEYIEAISGKEKTPALIEKFVADPELKEHIAFFEAAFPKYELIVDDYIFEDDKAVIRARGKGVHKGQLMNIPPTGKSIEVPLVAIYQVKNDKIVKNWLFFDRMLMMEQLGVMSSDN